MDQQVSNVIDDLDGLIDGEDDDLARILKKAKRIIVEYAQGGETYAQEMGSRESALGVVEYVKIRRHDGGRLTWRQLWDAFASRYPGRWAIQVLPPAKELVDEANIYHLFVLPEMPAGLSIRR